MEIAAFFQHPVVIICLTTIWTWFIWMMAHRSQMRKLPPGPSGLPLFGYYPFLSAVSHKVYARMSEFYGEIFSFRSLGGNLIVVLNSRPIIKEVFLKRENEFDRRPNVHNVFSWITDGLGFVQENKQTWEEQRRFFLEVGQSIGIGKPELEKKIQKEITAMMEGIRNTKEQPVDVYSSISNVTGKIMSQILFHKTFEQDRTFEILLRALKNMTTVFEGKTSIAVGFAFRLKCLVCSQMRKAQAFRDIARYIINGLIKEQEKALDPNISGGYVSAYLQHRNDLLTRGKDNEGSFTIERLQANTMNLLFEGTVTVSSTITALLEELSKHPDVQEAAQKELDSSVGGGRLLTCADKQNLPYLDATLQELYRIATPNLITRFCSNLKETRIDGYLIPSRSLICANLASLHFDSEIFLDPLKFDPKRFLDEHGKRVDKNRHYAFGLGKRSCLGESLAEAEVFLIIGSILQNFKVTSGNKKGALKFLQRERK
ncbi:cytochrome P450 2C20-like [Argiope bruennichi]|uniref:cytochrome P450 2C20-like n=1 Tax=Argiope bruennichi TaxID=94029 RepID=UPI002494EC15|nr:cytochrome P450 2C20-like [Argiope bruennichi]